MDYFEKNLEHYLVRKIYTLAIINDLSVLRTFYSICTMTKTGFVWIILGSTFMSMY